ncbi:DNA-binding protein [Actinophytocola xinjiangensis]|uniref:DNA-binding protein n=1 Tax=Actinophytocola xinjiangensis TaxID=485602 RepID=A0A7Z0WNC8_9PSEU|nr:helix-turn-helix transcriptional regulator [Actinophytocola xinjiangensis]OLF11588.1 DNA-binding protein [Actinophytocola xinjiangensis]
MVAHVSRSAVRRWIAIELKRLREDAGYETDEVAARISKGVGAYRHYENNVRMPSASDMEVLLTWYGKPERADFFRELLRAAHRGKDWWTSFTTAVPDWFELYLGLEYGAARISSYDTVIPGLLQTREYAEALIRSGEHHLTEEQVAEQVEMRMARQQTLLRDVGAPQLWSVLDEGAVQRVVGGPEVMRAQLEHLTTMSKRSNVEIQMLPNSVGAHPGMDGAFAILDYPAAFTGDPGTVYVQTRLRGIYYENMAEVTDYRRVFERLQMLALRPDESREALAR